MPSRNYEKRRARRKAEKLPPVPPKQAEDKVRPGRRFQKPVGQPDLRQEAAERSPKGRMGNYVDRLSALRQKRIEKRCGKRLIVPESQMLGYVFDNKVPAMMQHCILKVYLRMPGKPKERCISAFNICAATFQRYGYLRKGTMSPTGKGMKRNRMHQREPVAAKKRNRYWALMTRLWASALQRVSSERDVAGVDAKKKR